MSELRVLTACGYLVPSDRVCDGSINVSKGYCQRCLIYSKNPRKRPPVFSLNTPPFSIKKRVVVKVHAFGVTLVPQQLTKTTVEIR